MWLNSRFYREVGLAARFSHFEFSQFLKKLFKAFPTRISILLKKGSTERVVQLKYPEEIVNKIAVDFYKHQAFLDSPGVSKLKNVGLNRLLSFRPNVSHRFLITLSDSSFIIFDILTLDASHETGIESIISSPVFYFGEDVCFNLQKAIASGKLNRIQCDKVLLAFSG